MRFEVFIIVNEIYLQSEDGQIQRQTDDKINHNRLNYVAECS